MWFLLLAMSLFVSVSASAMTYDEYAAEHDLELQEEIATVRQDLANETFNFLYKHALCVDGQDAPCDWVYDGAYELHLCAKELYSTKDLKQIKMPVSEWKRGGYTSYWSPITYLQHESIMFRIYMLLKFGFDGIPKQELRS